VRAAAGSERRYCWLRLPCVMVAPALLMVLAGCGNGKCEIPTTGNAQENVASSLRIDDFGPHVAKVGQPFNRQPDGSAAAWFRLNESMEGSLVHVHLNSVVLKGDISGPMVTVRVPKDLYASEGRITIVIDKVNGTNVTTSKSVDIIVDRP